MSDKPVRDGRACFYAVILPHAIAAARECGYALAVHGSLVDDLDLVAVPWIEEARSTVELVEAVMKAVGGFVPGCVLPGVPLDAKPAIEREACRKPHGRATWVITWMGHVRIDLSVMQLATATGGTK